MNNLSKLKDQNIFVEYSKKKNDLEVFREESTTRIQEMSEEAYSLIQERIAEVFYDVRFTGVKYQELLNRVYERIPIACKHPDYKLARLSFGSDEIFGEAYTNDDKKIRFSITYDELTMTDRQYKSYVKKIIAKAEKEVLSDVDCLRMLNVESYQSIVDVQRKFFKVFDLWPLMDKVTDEKTTQKSTA